MAYDQLVDELINQHERTERVNKIVCQHDACDLAVVRVVGTNLVFAPRHSRREIHRNNFTKEDLCQWLSQILANERANNLQSNGY